MTKRTFYFAMTVAAFLATPALAQTRIGNESSALIQLWPAAIGLLVAAAIAAACYLAVRNSRGTAGFDDVTVWRALAENTTETVFLLSRNGRVLYLNRWPGDTQDVVGKPFEALVSETDKARWREFFVLQHAHPNTCSVAVFKVMLEEGAVSFWELRLAALTPTASEAEYMLCGRDVTEIHRRQASKDALYRITMAATQTDSLVDLVRFAEQQLSGIIDTRNFYLAIYHKESDSYSRIFSKDLQLENESIRTAEKLKGGLTDYVRTLGKHVLMNDENREHLRNEAGVISLGNSAACWLGVPLIVGNEVDGVFVVQSYDNPKCFSPADAELLSIVAASIGRVLEREQTHKELVNRETKLRLLTDRLPALIWSEDASGFITYVSGTVLPELNLTPADFMGRKLADVVICEPKSSYHIVDASNSGDSEFRFKFNQRVFDAFVETLTNENGSPSGAAGIALDVTERDRADNELRRFSSLSADAFIVVNRETDIVRCNEGFLEITGYSKGEVMGLPSIRLVHEEDMDAARSSLAKLTDGEAVVALELRFRCADGNYKWISWNAVFNPEDEMIYCSGKDITLRRNMENDLRERKEQLRLFIQHSPAALAMFDREMKYLVVSERWRVDYGLGDLHFIGKSHYEVFPEIGEEWKAIHRRCLEGATESCAKDPFPRADGKLDWVRWEIKPWFTGAGEIGGIIMFTEVITDEVNAELEAQKSRNLARQIIASSLDAVVAVDVNCLVTEWNPQAEIIFGYSLDEAIGKHLAELIIPERLAEGFHRNMRNLIEHGNSRLLQRMVHLPAKRKDGCEFPAELSVGVIQLGQELQYSAFIRDISERQQREHELSESRHRLKEAQRIAGLGFWEWNATTGELHLSEEKLALYGLPDLQLPTTLEFFFSVVHPDDREHAQTAFQSILDKHERVSHQYRVVRPDGEIRYAYSQGEVELTPDGTLKRVFGTTLDVTERVQADERIRLSEQRLALAFEGSSDGFWDWNVITGDCYFSPRIVEWLGFDPSEFLHHVSFWETLIHPDYLQAFNEAYQSHIDNRTTHYEIEERVRTKSGEWIWVLSRGKVVQWNEDGTPLRAAGTWTNITSRKLMEARATQLGRILDNSMNEVYVIDPMTFQIIEANQRACLNTGFSTAELQKMKVHDLLEDWNEGDLRSLGAPLLTGAAEVIRGAGLHVRKDGSTYPYETTVQIMDWYDKVVFVSVGNDVSEKRRAEKEFENLQAQLRHAQRLETIGTLAGGIAHDFNNILTPILGYADMAAGELDPDSSSRRDIEQVIQAAYRAKGLVQQILAFSRQSEQARHPLNFDVVVKETIRLMRASVPPHIEIIQSIENVGAVLSDPTLLNQILMNLCTNAYQAISDESGEIEITLTTERIRDSEFAERNRLAEGSYAKLTVRDTGAGMDTATIGRIFEPFFTTKEVGQGTGLGLSVVHGIVQAHGGAITVDSRVGLGTRVTVYLPLLAEIESPEAGFAPEVPRGSEHLLLCDDDETILILAKHMLESFGYQVTATVDPVTALALLSQADPPIAALIVDDRMPILSGHHVALAAHDFNPDLPVILLSASSNLDIDTSAFSAVLSKPVVSSDLAFAVRNSIRNFQHMEVQ